MVITRGPLGDSKFMIIKRMTFWAFLLSSSYFFFLDFSSFVLLIDFLANLAAREFLPAYSRKLYVYPVTIYRSIIRKCSSEREGPWEVCELKVWCGGLPSYGPSVVWAGGCRTWGTI